MCLSNLSISLRLLLEFTVRDIWIFGLADPQNPWKYGAPRHFDYFTVIRKWVIAVLNVLLYNSFI